MGYKSPVYHVIAVPVEKIEPNTYNPNSVAPPELKLLSRMATRCRLSAIMIGNGTSISW